MRLLLVASSILVGSALLGCSGDSPARHEPTAAAYDDVPAYCRAVNTVDQPDQRWAGDPTPRQVVDAATLKFSAQLVMDNKVLWRCMSGDAVWCLYWGTNYCPKGDSSTVPSDGTVSTCALERDAETVGRAVTGTATIWDWGCSDGSPVIKGQFTQVDAGGFHADVWHVLTSAGSDRLVPTVAVAR